MLRDPGSWIGLGDYPWRKRSMEEMRAEDRHDPMGWSNLPNSSHSNVQTSLSSVKILPKIGYSVHDIMNAAMPMIMVAKEFSGLSRFSECNTSGMPGRKLCIFGTNE